MLQALLGKEWISSYIDIYVSEDGVPEVRRRLSSMGYYREGWPDYPARDEDEYYFSKVGPRLESLEVWLSKDPTMGARREYDRDMLRGEFCQQSVGVLQLMVVKRSLPRVEDIVRGFDLNIVMNTWDGRSLSIANLDLWSEECFRVCVRDDLLGRKRHEAFLRTV